MPRSGTDSSGRERAPRLVTAIAAFTATLWISGCASVTNTPAPAVVAPHVAYTFRILDDPTTGTTGNGDGRIQRGETVRLLLDFKNVSPDPLERVFVDVASPVTSGFTLDSSRIELGALRAEE